MTYDLKTGEGEKTMLTHIFAWPITPERLRAARRLIESVRSKGGKFKLDADRRGWRMTTPKSFPIPPELHDQVCELGDEILYALREEEPGNLAISD
jgi:hypothetical protein